MSINVGVILLSQRRLNGERLDIEDNIGECIGPRGGDYAVVHADFIWVHSERTDGTANL